MNETDKPLTQPVTGLTIKSSTADSVTLRGYAVVFGGVDVEGDTFTSDTDLAWDYVPQKAVLWEHARDDEVRDTPLGAIVASGVDGTGRWIEAQVERARAYGQRILQLIERGVPLGLSTASIPHLVQKDGGHIVKWPVVEVSLTATPAEPRTRGLHLKALEGSAINITTQQIPLEAEALPEGAGDASAVAQPTGQAVESEPVQKMQQLGDETMDDLKAIVADALAPLTAELANMKAALPLTSPGFAVSAGVKAEPKDTSPLYRGLGEFLLDVAKSGQGPANRKMEELKSSDPLDENGYNIAKALGDPFVGSLARAALHGRSLKATGLNESVGADGGFLVGTNRAAGLIERVYDVGQVLQRVDMTGISAASNGMTFNAEDETSRADGSRRGGIRAYWAAEAIEKTASQPKFRQMEMKLKKLIGLVYATDELQADASALDSYVQRNLPEELRYTAEDSVFNGTGLGQPSGVMNSGALITVAKENNQAADTVVAENIMKMFARMWPRSLGRAVWYISQDVWPQLFQMHIAVGTGGVPVFVPPGGLSAAPYGTLMGRPILPIEYADKLGDLGDIVLADLGEYQMIEKSGMQAASSIHVKFVYDETCFRFVWRVDGQTKWNSPLTPKNGGDTLSPFVTLAAR